MRLIDADALKLDIMCVYGSSPKYLNWLNHAPTVDAVPVRHGKWKQWDDYGFDDTYKCTACGESFVLIEGTPITNGYKYCPNCGARMDEE